MLTGPPSLATGLAIAAALILGGFMHLREVPGLVRVVAMADFFWLLILLALGALAYI